MIRLTLVDDHPAVLAGLSSALREHGILVVAQTSSPMHAEHLAMESGADIIVSDISMPEMSGLDFLRHVKEAFPDLPVLIYSMHTDPLLVAELIKLGASGFVGKHEPTSVLAEAIKLIAAGGEYIPASAQIAVAQSLKRSALPTPTERELQILKLICSGLINKEIAAQTGLTVRTIETIRLTLCRKLKARSPAELGIIATRRGYCQ